MVMNSFIIKKMKIKFILDQKYTKKQIIKYNKLSNQFFNAISNLVSVYEKNKILSNIYDATKVLNVTLGLLYSAKNKSIKFQYLLK